MTLLRAAAIVGTYARWRSGTCNARPILRPLESIVTLALELSRVAVVIVNGGLKQGLCRSGPSYGTTETFWGWGIKLSLGPSC